MPDRPGQERPVRPPLTNPRAERVTAVRRLSGRSARLRSGRFAVEGPQAVREAVAAHRRALAQGRPGVVVELYASELAAQRHEQVLRSAGEAGLPAVLVSGEVLDAMSDTVTPQGLVAVCRLLDLSLASVLAGSPRLVAVLAHVRDPGNAGAVIRAADAAGADAVVVTDASVDVHNPKCVRSTAGSLFHLPVLTGASLSEAVAGLRAAGLVVYAADAAGDTDLDQLLDAAERDGGRSDFRAVDVGAVTVGRGLAGPTGWIFGNEAWGLSETDRALADQVVRVPIHGLAESLNLAMAAAVCLYASARAQRAGP